jgi:hypothetical protein
MRGVLRAKGKQRMHDTEKKVLVELTREELDLVSGGAAENVFRIHNAINPDVKTTVSIEGNTNGRVNLHYHYLSS